MNPEDGSAHPVRFQTARQSSTSKPRVYLSTPCAWIGCGHPFNWHTVGACAVDDCPCIAFVAPPGSGTVSPARGVLPWVITAVAIGVLLALAGLPLGVFESLVILGGGLLAASVLLVAAWMVLGWRAKRRRCGGECDEGHTYAGRCELAPEIWRLGDGSLTAPFDPSMPPGIVVDNPRGTGWYWTCTTCEASAGKFESDDAARAAAVTEHPACPPDPDGPYAWTLPGAADGPLAGTGTSGSKGREATTPAGPEGVSGSDGALTGDDASPRGRISAAFTEVLDLFERIEWDGDRYDWMCTSTVAPEDFDRWRALLAPVEQLPGARAGTAEQPDEQQLRDALAAIEAKLAGARRMSCGHDATSSCEQCDATERAWRTELAAAYWELQLAVAHDRQPYPTAEAYTAVCAALGRHRERADRAEAAIDRVRAIKKAPGRSAANRYANAQDDAWDQALDEVRAALDARADESGPAALDVVQAAPEQPVSDPQPVDESADDSCQVVHVDGGPVLVRGQGEMDETAAAFFAEIVQAGKRKYAAEHPDAQDGDG